MKDEWLMLYFKSYTFQHFLFNLNISDPENFNENIIYQTTTKFGLVGT